MTPLEISIVLKMKDLGISLETSRIAMGFLYNKKFMQEEIYVWLDEMRNSHVPIDDQQVIRKLYYTITDEALKENDM